jgi:hypothetical protein
MYPLPLRERARVRGVFVGSSPLMPTFHKAFKEVGIVPIS